MMRYIVVWKDASGITHTRRCKTEQIAKKLAKIINGKVFTTERD